ncbi:T9SS type B sorting domain-containing protein [Lutibacter sp.]|uniref:T9SS type B sorting domain-containing protein n=1 Tax=Lutibacter sp. TaxID=1925666 RepID=UPI001A1EED93|nr:T9SS type B sorting domain-containing protein [Lutibacter sp.]MBI9041294.1 T9SS type B sorting domain-containing protein [Lutibacter sp.]
MKRVVFLLLVLFPIVSFSQKEAAIWYFGQYAGLDFNSGAPVVLTNGQLNTFEGCATISDYLGNLLFYTDGVTVWNKNHLVMPNGTGLLGNASSTQSAIIVPKPGNLNQYYIFTVDDRNTTSPLSTNGIRFSTIDLTLNGGLGDVIPAQKNLTLVAQAYEKITAVKHADSNSFWVISFIQNRFLAWRVDAAGVNTTPIISNVSNALDSRGYLKVSPDGKKIACANFGTGSSLMIYDFNPATGIVSNEIQLSFDTTNDIPYGVEFSMQSQKLYVTTSQLSGNIHSPPGKLYQYNMASANISASRILIHSSNVNTRGGLQLAIDGKIYRALSITTTSQIGTAYLGVINNPESDGIACNYVHNAIDVSNGNPNRKVVEGLPPFIQSFFLSSISSKKYCFGDATEFTINSTAPPTSVLWNFGDPASGINNTSTIINPTHIFSSPGNYTINAAITVGTSTSIISTDITILNAPIVTSPVSLLQCDDDLDGFVNFNLQDANSLISTESPAPVITYFLTENNALNTINPITNSTAFNNATSNLVWARVENSAGCFTTAQVNLQVATTEIPSSLMVNFYQCDDTLDGNDENGFSNFNFSSATNQVLNALLPETNFVVTYYETFLNAVAQTNPIDPTNYRNITPTNQQIVVRVDNLSNQCFGIGYHVTLNVNSVPKFDLQNSVDFCFLSGNHSIEIENPVDNYQYSWKNEAGTVVGNTPSIIVNSAGLYTVTATDTNGNNCSKTKSIQVNSLTINPLASFTINNVQINEISTNNNTITVLTSNLPPSNYQFALDTGNYQNNNVFLNVSDGVHLVKIRDIDNCLEAEVYAPLIEIVATNFCFGDATDIYLTSSPLTPTNLIWNFGDPASGINNTSNALNPTHMYSNSGNFTITATVTFGINTSIIIKEITIQEYPIVNSPILLIQCDDDIDGFVNFNLQDANSLISTESPAPAITYFLNENNAVNNINPITNTTTFNNATSNLVWARVENSAGCFATAQVNLQVATTEIPSGLMLNFYLCDDILDGDDKNGISNFNFSTATNQVLNALLPDTNFRVSYYENISNAIAKLNPIDPTNYRNISPTTQQIVVRVDNLDNQCFGVGYHITLHVNAIPQFNLQNSVDFCFLSGNHSIGVENPVNNYQYTWKNQAGAVVGNTPSIIVNSSGLYSVTATDTNGNNCSKTKSIQVNSIPMSPLANFTINNIQINEVATNNNTITVLTNNLPPSNYQFALDSGNYQNSNIFLNVSEDYHKVHIRDINNCLEASLVAPIIKIYATNFCFGNETQFSLTPTLPPASDTNWNFNDPNLNNTSTIFNPTHIFSHSGNYVVSASVTFGLDTFIYTKKITINPLPQVNSPITLFMCDDNLNGIENFNLTNADSLISTENPAPTITYFLSETDAINNTSPISNTTSFSNSTSPIVWARVLNASNCFSIAQVNLVVESIEIPADLMLTFNECDDIADGNDTNGISIFNFSAATQQILSNFTPNLNLEITYYQNLADALSKINEIDPTNYRNISAPFNQKIAIRVENTTNGCFGIGYHLNLEVDSVPKFDLKTTVEFCFLSDSHEIGIENPLTDYNYIWENENGKTIGNTPTITINFEGEYFVNAIDVQGNNCIKTKSILVKSMPINNLLNFNSTNILVTDNSNNNTITINTDNLPISSYEFAIDDGNFSEISFYEYVPAGRHFVKIRDVVNCLEAIIEISLIGIPNFFTPNNDGYNDTWHVTGIDFQPTSNVYIFDRFGKLIAILDPLGPGWNGYYKGNPLPSTDYWYRVELEDRRLLKGHFSLIRR